MRLPRSGPRLPRVSNSNFVLRQIHARARLSIATIVAIAVGLLIPHALIDQAVTRALIAWNLGTGLYIALIVTMIVRASPEKLIRRAQIEDEGQHVVLGLVVVAVIASLAAIASELTVAKDTRGAVKSMHIGLAAMTVLFSWAFVHVIFALHYARAYYSSIGRKNRPGLEFPGTDEPDYWDFIYFSAIIGTSAQTADVSLVSRAMRRLCLIHCVLAFFFNTVVLALTINIAASIL